MRLLGASLGVIVGIATTVTSVTSAGVATAATNLAPIKIGTTIWSLPEVDLAIRLPGIKAAVRAINKSGGIKGHRLDWIECDEADANTAEACAHTMVSDGVVATIGDAVLNDELPFSQILAQGGVPQIDPFITAPQSFVNPNVFLPSGEANIEYATVLAFAKYIKIKTLHFLQVVSPSGADVLATVEKAATYYGLTVVGAPTEVPLTAADFEPYVADAESANADVTISAIPPFGNNLLLQAMSELGKKIRLGLDNQFDLAQTKQYGETGGPINGALVADMLPPESAANEFPALKSYISQITVEYKDGDTLASPNTRNSASLEDWLDVQVFAQVAKGLNKWTASSVKHAYNTEKNINMLGLLPPWTPSKKGPAGLTRVSQPWLYLMIIKNGETVLYRKQPVNSLLPFEK